MTMRPTLCTDVPRRAPTPADLLLLALLLGAVLLSWFRLPGVAVGEALWVHGASGSLRLETAVDRDVPIQGPLGETLLRIRQGRVWIAQAPCRARLCQSMGALEGGRGSLVCIPNQVVLRFGSAVEAVDGVTR